MEQLIYNSGKLVEESKLFYDVVNKVYYNRIPNNFTKCIYIKDGEFKINGITDTLHNLYCINLTKDYNFNLFSNINKLKIQEELVYYFKNFIGRKGSFFFYTENEDVLNEIAVKELDDTNEVFYFKKIYDFEKNYTRKRRNEYKEYYPEAFNPAYGFNDNKVFFNLVEKSFKKGKLLYKIPETLFELVREIDYSVGIETEVNAGNIPTRKLAHTGFVALRDGSLKRRDAYDGRATYTPYEYTSIPLYSKGAILKSITNISGLLKDYCKYNSRGSLHIHMGNFNTNSEYVISLFILFQIIQDELFSMFPYYKTDRSVLDNEKNYCQKLPTPNRAGLFLFNIKMFNKDKEGFDVSRKYTLNKIFNFLCGQNLSAEYNRDNGRNKGIMIHPLGQNKWNRNRYFALNVENLFFSKSQTAELRISNMTDDPIKITILIVLFNSIIKFSQNNCKELIDNSSRNKLSHINLNCILDNTIKSDKVKKIIKDYIELRKQKSFKNDELGDNERKIICQIEEEDMITREK